jgi:hypothetical protein
MIPKVEVSEVNLYIRLEFSVDNEHPNQNFKYR